MTHTPPRSFFILWSVIILSLVGCVTQIYLRVDSLQCQIKDKGECPQELTSTLLDTVRGTFILGESWRDSANSTLAATAGMRLVKVERELPSTLKIEVEQHRLLADVLTGETQPIWKVFEQGELIKTPGTDVFFENTLQIWIPTLLAKPPETAGDWPPTLVAQLRQLAISIPLLPNPLSDKVTALVDLPAVESELTRLSALLKSEQYASLSATVTTIDMRFKRPVLK
jgi:hypothetical protein